MSNTTEDATSGARRVLYAEAVYGEREIEAVVDVLRHRRHQLMNGPAVREFESRIAALLGKRFGVMVNSGSSANLLAIASLDLPRDSEIITPALTFATTVTPLLQCGLIPAFIDVEPDTFVSDVSQIDALIGPKTRGLMIPNLIGNLPDWSALRAVADRHGLALLEDCADTLGARFDDRPTGMLSDISTTSFYASHVLTGAGSGGMLCTNDLTLANRARLLRGWGRSSAQTDESERMEDRFGTMLGDIPYDGKFVFTARGYNLLPSEISAAFGLVQLESLESFLQSRRDNFMQLLRYFTRFESWLMVPRLNPRAHTAWLAFPLVVRSSAPFGRRELQMYFEAHGIQTRTVFTGNILRQPAFADIPRRERAEGYPNADGIMRGGLLLGCHQGLASPDIDYICDTFEGFAKRY
jgi:CDP-4-dehydro-6-deoxyglucose reductase, E1